MSDGYLLNSLFAWKQERQREHRMLMSRYASLERQNHPCLRSQGKAIELNRKIIELIDAAIAEAMADPAHGSAVLSPCGLYRYCLSRRVTASNRTATFIMLNPSTADADNDDPTIQRCIGFARAWGCGRLLVANIFAFRATKPTDMLAASDPIGPDNDRAILDAALEASLSGGPVICAWGAHGKYRDRDRDVLANLAAASIEPMSLGETAQNLPRHPLYLRGDCRPLPYAGRAR